MRHSFRASYARTLQPSKKKKHTTKVRRRLFGLTPTFGDSHFLNARGKNNQANTVELSVIHTGAFSPPRC